jgi:hypothetical protein
VRQCLAAVNAVAQRGTIGATMQDIVLNWDHAAPDAAPFFSMTGMGAGTQRAALSITAMPTPSGSCAILLSVCRRARELRECRRAGTAPLSRRQADRWHHCPSKSQKSGRNLYPHPESGQLHRH